MNIVIGIGDYAISNKKEDYLKTFALATCVGVTMYCPQKKVAGMVHIALPNHQKYGESYSKPCYYASLGLPLILQKLEKEYGCKLENLIIQLFGGAESICKKDYFQIGKQNRTAITSLLDERRLKYSMGSVGGYLSRTIEMAVETGTIKMETQPIRI